MAAGGADGNLQFLHSFSAFYISSNHVPRGLKYIGDWATDELYQYLTQTFKPDTIHTFVYADGGVDYAGGGGVLLLLNWR